ncbi:21598_t:CDS:2, partial [Dentiscutata erythropus]
VVSKGVVDKIKMSLGVSRNVDGMYNTEELEFKGTNIKSKDYDDSDKMLYENWTDQVICAYRNCGR